jgi:hypothetical protein
LIYPEQEWDSTKFGTESYWKSITNQRSLFDRLAKRLHIKNTEDWYKVKRADISKHGSFITMAILTTCRRRKFTQ